MAKFDQQILDHIGLSDAEATSLIKKHQSYLKKLTPKQHEVVKQSMPSWKEAAAAVHPKCTAKNLQDFVAARGEAPNPAGALCVPYGLKPAAPPKQS